MISTTTTTSCDESLSDNASQSSSFTQSSLSSLHSSFRIAGTYRTASKTRRKRFSNLPDWGQSSSSLQTVISESSSTTGNSSMGPKSLYYQRVAVALRRPLTFLLQHANAIVFLAIFGTLVVTNPLARELLDHCASASGVILGIWTFVGYHHPSIENIHATALGICRRPAAFCRALLELNTVDHS